MSRWRDKILEERGNFIKLQFEDPIPEDRLPLLEIDEQDEELIVAHDGQTALVAVKDIEIICHHEGESLKIFICRGPDVLDELTISLTDL